MNKKNLLFASVILLATVAACTHKAAPAASVEKKQPETEQKVVAQAPATNGAQIADGGKIYEARCGKCHELHKPDEFTASEWPDILRSMAPKAKLNQSMKEMVMAYVTANAKKG